VAAKSVRKKTRSGKSSAPARKLKQGRKVASEQGIPARILTAVRRIPRGRVSTYGDIADVAGLPRRARMVGTVLRQTPSSRDVPWFRVINAGGRISFPAGSDAYERQRKKLESEGVVFISGRVSLKKYGWPAREEQLDELLWKIGEH